MMTTCKMNGTPVVGGTCGLVMCGSNECDAPAGHKCIHMDHEQLREYTLTTRHPDGSKGRIVLRARSASEAEALTGGAQVVGSKSEPWRAGGGIPCDQCGGYGFELIGCCSGHECGCMGQPVDAKPCARCNPDGKKEPSLQAQRDWPWFFLTEEEWNRHQQLQNKKAALLKWINEPADDAGDVDAWNKHAMLVESWQKSLKLIDAELER